MRPAHILFIQADQFRADCLGAAGHPLVRTPHLDALAAGGARFESAFCTSPVCVPTRNSLLYGCWPSRHGVVSNIGTEAHAEARPGLRAFSQVLADGGWQVAQVGKWGASRVVQPADLGFSHYRPLAEYDAWRAEAGLPPVPTAGGWWGEADTGISAAQSAPAWGADRTIELLTRAAADDQPWFIRWDTNEPHLPCRPPEPFASLYDPATVPPWPSFADGLAGKPYIQAQQRRTWGLEGWSWAEWAPIVARYLGLITHLDEQFGRVLAALDELGLAADTLVIFSSDHGDTCGGHGMIDKHFIMYDDVWRVPLLARWPGQIAAGTVSQAFVTTPLDLAATFVEAAGLELPDTFQGHGLPALLAGAVERDAVYGTYAGSQFGLYSQRAVRERRYKYVWNPTAEDEFYDLEADPGELVNRATDPALAGEVARLRAKLADWLRATGDPLDNAWNQTTLREGRKE